MSGFVTFIIIVVVISVISDTLKKAAEKKGNLGNLGSEENLETEISGILARLESPNVSSNKKKQNKKKKRNRGYGNHDDVNLSLETDFGNEADSSLEANFSGKEVSIEKRENFQKYARKVERELETSDFSTSIKKKKSVPSFLDFTKDSLVKGVIWKEILQRKDKF
jgi:regulatory protein YycI of two-component signal transduction system YycFG